MLLAERLARSRGARGACVLRSMAGADRVPEDSLRTSSSKPCSSMVVPQSVFERTRSCASRRFPIIRQPREASRPTGRTWMSRRPDDQASDEPVLEAVELTADGRFPPFLLMRCTPSRPEEVEAGTPSRPMRTAPDTVPPEAIEEDDEDEYDDEPATVHCRGGC